MMCDLFALSPERRSISQSPKKKSPKKSHSPKKSPKKHVVEQEMTPEKVSRVLKPRPKRIGHRSIEESLRTWKLEEHFEVTAEGHVGCKLCMAHSQRMAHLAKGPRYSSEQLIKARKAEGGSCYSSEQLTEGRQVTQKKYRGKHGKTRKAEGLSEGKFAGGKCRNMRCSLKKHLMGSKHVQAARKARGEQEDDTVADDVPTDAQMYITYDIVKKDPVAGGGPQYEERCRDARASGDLINVPAFRCSPPIFHQNVHSIAEAVKIYIFEKLLSKRNPVKFMCWAEDACKQFEQMMVRVVFKDRSEEDILVKWHWHMGKASAHEKAQAIAQALESFSSSPGCSEEKMADVTAIFKKFCKAFVADGAYAEPLAALLAKAREVLPFRYAGRCLMHAKQRNLENSVNSDPDLKVIVDLLVKEKACGGSESSVWMGGLCRALKNRDRLRSNFSANVEEELKKVQEALTELGEEWTGPEKMPTGRHSVSSAPQRFDSILTALRTIVLNFRAVLIFLVSLQGPWALRLLKLLQSGETHVQLAALCEYMEMVSVYVHKDEGHQASKSSLLTAAGDFLTLCEDLCYMFTGDEEKEKPPRCTSADYSKGYYQILKKSLASLGDEFVYRTEDGETLFGFQEPSPEEEATVIANAMKKMQHVIEVFEVSCKVDLEMALGAAQPINRNAHAIIKNI